MEQEPIFTEPVYPIFFKFEDGETWRFDDAEQMGITLETWDTAKDPEQIVFDALDRPVRLRVATFRVQLLELQ